MGPESLFRFRDLYCDFWEVQGTRSEGRIVRERVEGHVWKTGSLTSKSEGTSEDVETETTIEREGQRNKTTNRLSKVGNSGLSLAGGGTSKRTTE